MLPLALLAEVNSDGAPNDYRQLNNVFVPITHHFPSSAAQHNFAKRQDSNTQFLAPLLPLIYQFFLNVVPLTLPPTLKAVKKSKKKKKFKKLGKTLFLKKLTLKTLPKKGNLLKLQTKKTKIKGLPVPLGFVFKKSKKGFKKSKKGFKKSKKGFKKSIPVLFKKPKVGIKKSKPVIKKLKPVFTKLKPVIKKQKPVIKKGAKKVIKKGTAATASASIPISAIGIPGLGFGALSVGAVSAPIGIGAPVGFGTGTPIPGPGIGAPVGFGTGIPIPGPGIGAPVGFGAGIAGVRLVSPGFVGTTGFLNSFFN